MHIIQHRKSSIFRAVILVALLEFTFVEKSFSNQKTCGDRNTRNISYFTLHSEVVNWDEAWRQCNNQSATLPVICNKRDQDAFTKYLRQETRYPFAWTSARKIVFDEWKWIDGQSFTSEVLDAAANEHYTRAYFDLARNYYKAAEPRRERHYLCYHNSSSSCIFGNDIQVKNGCVRSSNDERSWYDARNQCIGDGGDLAKVYDDDLVTLRNSKKLNADRGYWIGLRNNTWRWVRYKAEPADHSGEEVKYTNWANNQPDASRECISIDASNGGWNSFSCNGWNNVICQKSIGSDETTSSRTTLSTTTTSLTTSSSILPSTKSRRGPTMSSKSSSTRSRPRYTNSRAPSRATTSALSSISKSTTQSTNDVESQVRLYSGVGAGIAIIIICIIIIILVVRCTRKPHKDMNQSNVKNNSDQIGIDLSPNIPVTSPANARTNVPVSPLVAGTDDAQGVYADIALAPLNQSEDEARIQQPGVLYAALEFQKEPTYLEPNRKNANASDQTKVGPMGDIYAIPDAKGRTGNQPANHPVIVTSQGDVYALPVKNSKSPIANTPVGGIYANL